MQLLSSCNSLANTLWVLEMIEDFANRYLQKQENVSKAAEAVKSKKVFDYLNQMVFKNVKNVTYEEFTHIVREHKH